MSKSVFITGAAGFIGFHLANYLQSRGDQVLGYDNFNDYYDVKLKYKRRALLQNRGISIIEGDVVDEELLLQSILQHKTTHIVHLAAQAGVRYSLKHPRKYLHSNIDGFLSILEICRRYPAIKLTYASSSSVYGLNQTLPFSTADRTDHQTSLYGVTKKTNELMAHAYHHLFGLSTTGLRFFTVYGPWGRPDMAYYAFADAIVQGKTIELYNEGKMLRDFTYIDDIVAGTAAAMDFEGGCEIFNLGNHCLVEVIELVSHLEYFLNKKASVCFLPMPKADVVATYADIERSAALLGFVPKTAIKAGIEQFVDWYKGVLTSRF